MENKKEEVFPTFKEYLKAPTIIMLEVLSGIMVVAGIIAMASIHHWIGLLMGIPMLLTPFLGLPLTYKEYLDRKKWFDSSSLYTVKWYDEEKSLIATFRHIRAASRDEARRKARHLIPHRYWDAIEET